jgi:sugar transferase (PEP-CTERM/EpsH1 system associated)
MLTQRLPYAPNRGDRLRAWHMLRVLVPHVEIMVGALVHDTEEAAHIGDMKALAARTVVGRVPHLGNRVRGALSLLGHRALTLSLLDSAELRRELSALVAQARPDVVFAYCSSMARFALEPPLAGLPLVIDMVDADSAKWADLGEKTRGPMGWVYRREAHTLGAFEAQAMRRAKTTLCVNAREADTLRALAPEADVRIIENGIDLDRFRPVEPPAESREVVFCGVMNYAPNVEGARWLAREVWPRVRAACPDACLTLVGASPAPDVQALAAPDAGITVTGAVPDVRPYLWRAAVAAAPLWTARGVQNKVLEAVAAGLPCVATPPVVQGLPAEVLPTCVEALDAEAFATALVEALRATPAARRARADAANLAPLTWESKLRELPAILRAVSVT